MTFAFTGGGTGGHIYPGLAVAESLKAACAARGESARIIWIGSSRGMDARLAGESPLVDFFYGVPSGKLRRYFSLQNIADVFKIVAGFFASLSIMRREKPDLLFSKGGFVSVPPCAAARAARVPVFTHESDFTPGLATRINCASAEKILVSYEETKKFIKARHRAKVSATGNPVRPSFFEADAKRGLAFLGIKEKSKPILMFAGGSLGAAQINGLVSRDIDWLCERFIVVHQAGRGNLGGVPNDRPGYLPFEFIAGEMRDVLAAADIVVSRAGANSLWECAALAKPLVLIPLCGSGTRGDQAQNALYFESRGAAKVLAGGAATTENLRAALLSLAGEGARSSLSSAISSLLPSERAADAIARMMLERAAAR